MDRILIILKKENGTWASSVPALGLNTMIFQHVYWYMQQTSGERLQDHWSSGWRYDALKWKVMDFALCVCSLTWKPINVSC